MRLSGRLQVERVRRLSQFWTLHSSVMNPSRSLLRLLNSELPVSLSCLIVLSMCSPILYWFINWKPGKVQCTIRVRGRRSGVVFRELCCNGGRQIAVPGTSPVVHLQNVKRYKRLGCFIQDKESLDSDALHKSRTALGAYSPIAYRVFGSGACCAWLKFQLMDQLINSSLLN